MNISQLKLRTEKFDDNNDNDDDDGEDDDDDDDNNNNNKQEFISSLSAHLLRVHCMDPLNALVRG